MGGKGFAPKPQDQRINAHDPQRGDWVAAPTDGWQHGRVPQPPSGLKAESKETWDTWFSAWFAAHWSPEDLPGLRMVIRLYNRSLAADCTAAERSELRQLMDSYGISKKGQQDRRWVKPKPDDAAKPEPRQGAKQSRYAHLRAVG